MTDDTVTIIGPNAAGRLKGFAERIGNVRSDKNDLNIDERAIFAEAKAGGFDTKTLRRVVKLAEMDPSKRESERALEDIYLDALCS